MEKSLTHFKVSYGHKANSSRDKRKLSKAERKRKDLEIFGRKASKILPDFFPIDMQPNKSNNQEKIILRLVKQYSWEKDGQCEAQIIAESWMMYFGFEPCDFTKCRV